MDGMLKYKQKFKNVIMTVLKIFYMGANKTLNGTRNHLQMLSEWFILRINVTFLKN